MANRSVRQAIREAVNRSPSLGQNALLRELRGQGIRISNTSGRSIIREQRVKLNRLRERFQEESLGVLGDIYRAETFGDPITFRESEIQSLSANAQLETLRQNIREREVFILRSGRRDSVLRFEFVRVQYTASATVEVHIEGRLYERVTRSFSGQFVQPVRSFTEELIASRITQQMSGALSTEFGTIRGLGSNSVIEGLDIRISDLDVRITSLEGRGQ